MGKTISRISAVVGFEDIDNNCHMNNAAYATHFEEGRQDLFEAHKLDPFSLEPREIALFVRNSQYTYKKPVEEGDKLNRNLVRRARKRSLRCYKPKNAS